MGPTSYRVGTATSTPYARTVAGSETRQTVLHRPGEEIVLVKYISFSRSANCACCQAGPLRASRVGE